MIPRETIAKMHAPHGLTSKAKLVGLRLRLADAVFRGRAGSPTCVPAAKARDATWAAVGKHAASPIHAAAGDALRTAARAAARGGA